MCWGWRPDAPLPTNYKDIKATAKGLGLKVGGVKKDSLLTGIAAKARKRLGIGEPSRQRTTSDEVLEGVLRHYRGEEDAPPTPKPSPAQPLGPLGFAVGSARQRYRDDVVLRDNALRHSNRGEATYQEQVVQAVGPADLAFRSRLERRLARRGRGSEPDPGSTGQIAKGESVVLRREDGRLRKSVTNRNLLSQYREDPGSIHWSLHGQESVSPSAKTRIAAEREFNQKQASYFPPPADPLSHPTKPIRLAPLNDRPGYYMDSDGTIKERPDRNAYGAELLARAATEPDSASSLRSGALLAPPRQLITGPVLSEARVGGLYSADADIRLLHARDQAERRRQEARERRIKTDASYDLAPEERVAASSVPPTVKGVVDAVNRRHEQRRKQERQKNERRNSPTRLHTQRVGGLGTGIDANDPHFALKLRRQLLEQVAGGQLTSDEALNRANTYGGFSANQLATFRHQVQRADGSVSRFAAQRDKDGNLIKDEQGNYRAGILGSRVQREVERRTRDLSPADAEGRRAPLSKATTSLVEQEAIQKQTTLVQRELLSAQQRLLKALYPQLPAAERARLAMEQVEAALRGEAKIITDTSGQLLGLAASVADAKAQGVKPKGAGGTGYYFGRARDALSGIPGKIGGAIQPPTTAALANSWARPKEQVYLSHYPCRIYRPASKVSAARPTKPLPGRVESIGLREGRAVRFRER